MLALLTAASLAAIRHAPEGSLHWYAGGVEHKYACADDGEFAGSCDVGDDLEILQLSDWSDACDPWRGVVFGQKIFDPKSGNFTKKGTSEVVPVQYEGNSRRTRETGEKWRCPVKHQSPSGCGDFRADPREQKCAVPTKLSCRWGTGRERRIVRREEPLLPQKHSCVARPIFYDNLNTNTDPNFGNPVGVVPPVNWRHREWWPMFGEYDYIPPQRWLHVAEHGGLVFLYNPCLEPADLCRLRAFIRKMQANMQGPGDAFRFVLTPLKNLFYPYAVVAWGEMYASTCLNEEELSQWVADHYRQAWEDVPVGGPCARGHAAHASLILCPTRVASLRAPLIRSLCALLK